MLSPHRIDIFVAVTLALCCASSSYERTAPVEPVEPVEPTLEQRRRLRRGRAHMSRDELARMLGYRDAADLAAADAGRAARYPVAHAAEFVGIDPADPGGDRSVAVAVEAPSVTAPEGEGAGESPVAGPLEAAAGPELEGAPDGPPEQCGGS